jgi:hypothetical protein
MTFYPTPFGHAEIHVDPRPKRPARYAEAVARRRAREGQAR